MHLFALLFWTRIGFLRCRFTKVCLRGSFWCGTHSFKCTGKNPSLNCPETIEAILFFQIGDFSVLWRALIVRHNGILNTNLDITSLSKISDGYTAGHIAQACRQVLTERRLAQLSRRRLVASEFVSPLAQIEPVYAEEEEAYKVSNSLILFLVL